MNKEEILKKVPKGNVSKRRVLTECTKYKRQIFWILMRNDFQFAKALWGKDVLISKFPITYPDNGERIPIWQFYLQKMVISPDPIKYLEQFI